MLVVLQICATDNTNFVMKICDQNSFAAVLESRRHMARKQAILAELSNSHNFKAAGCTQNYTAGGAVPKQGLMATLYCASPGLRLMAVGQTCN